MDSVGFFGSAFRFLAHSKGAVFLQRDFIRFKVLQSGTKFTVGRRILVTGTCFLALGFLSSCANVLSGQLYQNQPYHVGKCKVYGVQGNFEGWPSLTNYPVKVAHHLTDALKARGFETDYERKEPSEVLALRKTPSGEPGTVFVVTAESVVLETQNGVSHLNGISFFFIDVIDLASGKLVGHYRLRVATGIENLKSDEGGFRDTAKDFVKECIGESGVLMKGPAAGR